MVENSALGLVMLEAGVPVVVTGEEDHQAWLARYPVEPEQRRVAVSLAWCVIGAGKYRGQYAIEVRLDGQRVGELTYLMSRRYADVVGQVIDGGGTPGCEAVIRRGDRGLEVVLYLPRDPSSVIASPPQTALPVKRRSRRKVLIAVGAVVALFVVIGALSDPKTGEVPSAALTTSAASATTTTTAAPTTTTTTTTATTTTTTTITTTTVAPAPNPEPKPQPNPQPNPQPQPNPATQAPQPPPAPAPAPNDGCHPSYQPCVPYASDVDCAGGSGNGPAYVRGPIKVVGPDEYDLDRDGDGFGCE
jgi:hypothetical protein